MAGFRFSTLCALAVVGVLVFAPGATAQQIAGSLSNFDVHNENDEEMTNLELDLRNVLPADIIGHYQGPNAWGNPPIIRDISGTEVTWADFRNPILPGGMQHFGLVVDPEAPFPCSVQAYWTRHLKIEEIPVPWQWWRVDPAGLPVVVDVIGTDFPEPVQIVRQWATTTEFDWPPVPLDLLNWDETEDLPWSPPQIVDLFPGGQTELFIPVAQATNAVYVRYTVARLDDPDNIVTRFVNEAVMQPFVDPPTIIGNLSNFDAHNDTGKPVDDLELELFGVNPAQVIDWYRGPDAWGLFPDTDAPAIDARRDGSGTDVHWVDEWDPIPYSQTRHFGLILEPGVVPQAVRAYWTRVVKVWQIPVPWQWWELPPGDVVRDVIQFSDTFSEPNAQPSVQQAEPVTILRQWAVGAPLTLDDLTWDGTALLPWSNPEAVVLEPGDQTFLDIPVSEPTGQEQTGVFVRYEVMRDSVGGPAEARFINQAIVTGAGLTRQPMQIIGSMSNFDVVNVTPFPVTNLEIDMRLVQPEHILDWYRGADAWGLRPDPDPSLQTPLIRRLPQTEVTWADFLNPLPFCQTRHFGLDLIGDMWPSCGVQAYWTQHKKIFEIPVPWQTWRPEPGQPPVDPPLVVDVIRLSPEFAEPVIINREFAVEPFRMPLDELNWDLELTWQPVPVDPTILGPGDELEWPIAVSEEVLGVYVRYTVALAGNPDEIVTRFVNEAEVVVEPGRQLAPTIVGELSNFDAHNNTGKPVHDLELDIMNIVPEDIVDWYRGPDAWGVDPVIRWTPGGLTTEVTWVDDDDPIPHCETRHFGLYLGPTQQEPLVRAYWTRQVKVDQIPVPWQFWLAPGGGIVADVIQLSDTFPEPVVVRRQWARSSTVVPLDDLDWNVAALWQPAVPEVISLEPGFMTRLDIPVSAAQDAAILVRYEVGLPTSINSFVTRFVNEAILGPAVVSNLRFESKHDLEWRPSLYGDTRFDIVRGDLATMRAAASCGDAGCLPNGNDWPDHEYQDLSVPAPGAGYYYLVRPESGGQHGTYDLTWQHDEGRDAEVAGGGADCP